MFPIFAPWAGAEQERLSARGSVRQPSCFLVIVHESGFMGLRRAFARRLQAGCPGARGGTRSKG